MIQYNYKNEPDVYESEVDLMIENKNFIFTLVQNVYATPNVTNNELLIEYAFRKFINRRRCGYAIPYVYFLMDGTEHKCAKDTTKLDTISDFKNTNVEFQPVEDYDMLKNYLISLAENDNIEAFYIKCKLICMVITVKVSLKTASKPFTITLTGKYEEDEEFIKNMENLGFKHKPIMFKLAYVNVSSR